MGYFKLCSPEKLTSIFFAVLLVSGFVTTGTFFVVPASADSGQSNSTQINTGSLSTTGVATSSDGKTHMWIMPHVKQGPKISSALAINANKPLTATAKLSSLSASPGFTPRNTGYCYFAPVLSCTNLVPAESPTPPTVMHNAKILLVFWVGPGYAGGSNCNSNTDSSSIFENAANDPTATSPNDCSYINEQVQFFKDMCSDPFMKIAAQYTDSGGGAGPCNVVGTNNPWIDNVNAIPSHPTVNANGPLLDSDIQAEASRMLTHAGLTANINTEVFVFTPYGKDSCFNSAGTSCFSNAYCAYHSMGSGNLVYSNMPDAYSAIVFGSGCGAFPSPNNDPVADLETSPLSHEAFESFTDPNVMTGYIDTSTGGEIGDECAYDNLVTTNPDNSDVHLGLHGDPYFIQTEWSNSNGGCAFVEQSLPLPPASPTGILASPASGSSIGLTWTAASGATSYNVFRDISSSGPFTTLAGSPTTNSFTDTGLSPTTTYYYKLTSSDTGGTSAITSPPASATTLIAVPPAPTGVAAASTPPTSITVSWTASGGATGYNVYRATAATGPFTTVLASPAASPYVDSGLTPNTKYFYKVSATNTAGESSLSAAVSATTAPAAPTNITPTALSTSSIKVTWTASTGATSYKVYRDTQASFATATLAGSSATTTFTDTGLNPGSQYYYEVSAVNANGESDKSAPPATTFTINIPPTGVAVTEASQTALSVSWIVAEGSVTGYKVYHATAAAGPFTLAGPSPGTSFGDDGLLSGKQYFYEVSTVNGGGESAKSNPIASGFTIPPTPIGIIATPTSSSSIILTWTASTGATSYSVSRDTTAAFTGPTVVGTPTTNSFTDNTGLSAGTQYYYEISAIDSGGASPLSSPPTTATTLPASPLAPANVAATPVSATSVTVTWDPSTGANVYTVYRSTSPSGPFTSPIHKITMSPLGPKGQTGTVLTTFTDTGLTPNTVYYYKIRASNSGGTSPLSEAASVSTLPLPPAPPGSVKATTLSTSSISVSWTASPTAAIYSIFRSSSPSGPFDTQVGTSTISPFIDNTLVSGTKYYYQISASNAGGVSLDSATVFATTITDMPGALTVTSPTTSTSASLTWEAPTGATSYKVYRSTSAVGPFTTSVGTPTVPSFTNTGLTPNTVYYYEISAVDAGGESAKTAAASALTAPVTPTNIMASRNPDNPSMALEISWNGAAGATGYNVYRSTSATGTFTLVTVSPDTGLLFGDSGLLPGTKYFYEISSVNAGGEGPKSTAVSGMTTPDAPTGLLASTLSSNSIGLTWTASPGATGYKVYRSTAPAGPFTTSVGTPTVPSFTNTGLTPNTVYYYEISAVDAGGESVLSSPANTITAPTIPTGAAAGPTSSTSISVSWSASTGALSYKVFRSTSSMGPFSVPVATPAASPYADTGLNPNTKYFYEISSVNEGGSSVPSTPPVFATTAPAAPTGVMATTMTTTSIKVSWTASTGATSYKVYRDTTVAFASPTLVGSPTTTTFTDTGLTPATTYYYEIKASNINGDSPLSGTPTSAPAAPTGISATILTPTSIKVTWNPSTGATSYKIYHTSSPSGPFNILAGTSTGTSFADTGLTPNVKYYYEVIALNGGSSSLPATPPASATTPPAMPTGVKANFLSPTSIKVTWNPSTGATSYKIYRSTSPAGPFNTVIGTSTVPSFTDTGLTPNVKYYYQVSALNGGSSSPPSLVIISVRAPP